MASVTEPRVDQEQTFVEWKAPARPFRKGGMQLMGVPMVIVVLVGLILLVAMEWMLIIVLAALVFAYYAWTMVPPEIVDYKVSSRGVRIGEKVYEWGGLYRWWIVEQWGQHILMIETPLSVVGRLAMPLGDVVLVKIEKIMSDMLLAEKPEDTNLDKAGKWLTEKFPLSEVKA